MNQFLQRLERRDLAVLLLFICCFGLLYSKAILSMGIMALMPLVLLDMQWLPNFSLRFRPKFKSLFQVYLSHPPYWGLTLMLLVVLLSVLYTGPSDYWFDRVRIKAPLFVAPVCLAMLRPISKRQLHSWMLGIIALGVISMASVLMHYFMHADEIIAGLKMGKAVPTPINHIRYSLFIVLCLSCAGWISYDRLAPRIWRLIAGGAALFFLIGLHILSVRSGLLAAYLVMLLALLYVVVDSKKYWLGIAGFLAIILLPLIAIKVSPALEARIGYAKYDLEQYFKGDINTNSDGGRIRSLQIGWETFKENKWLGTGVANFRATIKEKYTLQYPNQRDKKLPHNQYLSILASLGIIGGLLTFFGLLLPLFYKRQFRFFPLSALYVILLTSMLFENTLESTVGLNLFLLPAVLFLNYRSGQKNQDKS